MLKRNDWQHEDDGFYPRATLGELLMRAREIIEADVGPQPPVGKRKGGEAKVDQNWRRLLDACSTQPGYYIALSERHAKRALSRTQRLHGRLADIRHQVIGAEVQKVIEADRALVKESLGRTSR